MKKFSFILMLFSLLAAGCVDVSKAPVDTGKAAAEKNGKVQKESDQPNKFPILEYLPEGLSTAEIMEVGMDPKYAYKTMEISNKLQANLQDKKEWFLQYVAEKGEGQALPYHPNFGITEEEYELIANSDDYMRLIKKGESSVLTKHEGNQLILEADQSEVLKKLTFDLNSNSMQTVFGTLTYKGKVGASDNQKITGKWSGESWELTEGEIKDLEDIKTMDENTFMKIVKLNVGRLEETGDTLLHLDYREIKNGERSKVEEFLIIKK